MNLSLFSEFQPIYPGSQAYDSYNGDIIMKGNPSLIVRPKSKEEIQKILLLCRQEQIPLTCAGSRTSVTGASVSFGGILLILENLKWIHPPKILNSEKALIRVGAGVILGDLQKEVNRLGWHYPPDPTSKDEASLGGSIATNASGEETFYFGPTRNYIHALEILSSDGKIKRLERKTNPQDFLRHKSFGGFMTGPDELDCYIGSEGTLGVILEAELILVKKPESKTALLLFQKNLDECLNLVQFCALKIPDSGITALEYMDLACTEIMKKNSARLDFLSGVHTLCLKISNSCLEKTLTQIEAFYQNAMPESKNLYESSLIAQDFTEIEEIRRLRHLIPAHINEESRKWEVHGGGKVSSDWWTPNHLSLRNTFEEANKLGVSCYIFGHIGNGHPHINFIPKNREEKNKATEFTKKAAKKACLEGGGPCAEHGMGKIKSWAMDLLSPEQILNMKQTKCRLDKKNLMAPGNIFEVQRLYTATPEILPNRSYHSI